MDSHARGIGYRVELDGLARRTRRSRGAGPFVCTRGRQPATRPARYVLAREGALPRPGSCRHRGGPGGAVAGGEPRSADTDAQLASVLGGVEAMRGDFTSARQLTRRASDVLTNPWSYSRVRAARADLVGRGVVRRRCGGTAVEILTRSLDALETMGERTYLATRAAQLAQALYKLERLSTRCRQLRHEAQKPRRVTMYPPGSTSTPSAPNWPPTEETKAIAPSRKRSWRAHPSSEQTTRTSGARRAGSRRSSRRGGRSGDGAAGGGACDDAIRRGRRGTSCLREERRRLAATPSAS